MTGLRPIASDRGMSKNEAVPLITNGRVVRRTTLHSGVVVSCLISASSALALWLEANFETSFGSIPLYSRKNNGMRCPMTFSIDRASELTASWEGQHNAIRMPHILRREPLTEAEGADGDQFSPYWKIQGI